MKQLGILFLLLCASVAAMGQAYQEIIRENQRLPFAEIVQQVEDYYKDKDKGRGSGYKQFKRWEFFNEHRLTKDGFLQNVPRRVMDEFLNYRNFRTIKPNLNFDCSWETVGGTAYERISSGHNGGLGRVNSIMVDPADSDIVYVGTPAGGLWKTEDGGGWNPGSTTDLFWEPLTDGLPIIGVSGIAIDPTSPVNNRTIYILSGDGDGGHTESIGVLKSFDGGITWFETDLSFGVNSNVRGYKLIMHPTDPNILYAATSNGIYRTEDGGADWALEQSGWFTDIEFRPTTPDTMYATTPSNFYRSLDGGESWTILSDAACDITNKGTRMEIGVSPDNPNYVYILSGGVPVDVMGDPIAGTFNGVYRSTDNGECFSMRASSPNILGYPTDGSDGRHQGGYDLAIAVSPTDAEQVHIGGINCWRSDDGGQNWSNTSFWRENVAAASDYTHADIHTLNYFGSVLYCGSDGGVYRSTNDADDWANISQGLRITQFYRIAAYNDDGSDYVQGGAQDNGLNELVDSGSGFGNIGHWEGADGFECSPIPGDDVLIGSTQNGCLNRYSYPAGGLVGLTVFPGDSCGGAWLTPHLYDAGNDVVLAGFQDVWQSGDNGNNWTNISNGQIGAGVSNHLTVAPSNSSVIYVSKGNTIFRTTNGGTNWFNITSNLAGNGNITYFTIDPADEDRIWVSFSGFNAGSKVFSRDLGSEATWTNVSGSLPNLPANTIIYENGSADGLYVGMDVGVYYRDNNLGDWVFFSNALPNVIIMELDINYSTGKLYAGTFGRGVWCTDLISNCSDVCLFCPEYSNFHSSPNTYSSEDCILSNAVVWDGTEITYEAQNYIHLEENFHVKTAQGATFHGTIDPCNGGGGTQAITMANLRELSGFFLGKLPEWTPGEDGPEEPAVVANSWESAAPLGLNAYPNPTNGQLNVSLHLEQASPVAIQLYGMDGHRVKTLLAPMQLDAGTTQRVFDLSNVPDGSYILVVTTDTQRIQQPVVKVR